MVGERGNRPVSAVTSGGAAGSHPSGNAGYRPRQPPIEHRRAGQGRPVAVQWTGAQRPPLTGSGRDLALAPFGREQQPIGLLVAVDSQLVDVAPGGDGRCRCRQLPPPASPRQLMWRRRRSAGRGRHGRAGDLRRRSHRSAISASPWSSQAARPHFAPGGPENTSSSRSPAWRCCSVTVWV